MALIDLIGNYQELLEKKEILSEQTKTNNKAIEDLKAEIAQQMIDVDCPTVGLGDYTYTLQEKTIWSKKSEAALQAAGLDFMQTLREQGLGDLIKETVDSRTLNKTINTMVEEEDGISEELEAVLTNYDTYDIRRSKKTNRALKKAKVGKE